MNSDNARHLQCSQKVRDGMLNALAEVGEVTPLYQEFADAIRALEKSGGMYPQFMELATNGRQSLNSSALRLEKGLARQVEALRKLRDVILTIEKSHKGTW